MTDGSSQCITDFGWECEAKDEAGRHFAGTAEVVIDLRHEKDVHPDFRKVWKGDAIYDGDWGACFVGTTWEPSIPLVYTGTTTVGDISGIFEEPQRFKFGASENLSVIQDALERALGEMPELRIVCNSFKEDTLKVELYNILIDKGVDLSFMTGQSHRLDATDFVQLNFEIVKAYLDQPFKYVFEADNEPSLILVSDGYGVLNR